MPGWLRWLEHCPMHQKVVGSIPGRAYMGGNDQCHNFSLTLKSISLFLSLKSTNISSGEDFLKMYTVRGKE